MIDKLKSTFRSLNFTNNERKVILFITVVVVLGAGVKLYQNYFNPAKPDETSKTDSLFKVLSVKNDAISADSINNEIRTAAVSDSVNSKRKTKNSKQDFLQDTKININTAGKNELTKLPGVGEATAEKIIEYRSKKPFKKIEDFMKIKGIGIKKFEKAKEFIKLEN